MYAITACTIDVSLRVRAKSLFEVDDISQRQERGGGVRDLDEPSAAPVSA